MTQPDTERRPSGGGLGAKLGPLPVWAWLGLTVTGGVVVLLWLRSRNSAAASSSTGSTVSPDTATVSNLQDQLSVVSSQIRNLQGGASTSGTDSNGGYPVELIKYDKAPEVFARWSSGLVQHIGPAEFVLFQQHNVPLIITTDSAEYQRLIMYTTKQEGPVPPANQL